MPSRLNTVPKGGATQSLPLMQTLRRKRCGLLVRASAPPKRATNMRGKSLTQVCKVQPHMHATWRDHPAREPTRNALRRGTAALSRSPRKKVKHKRQQRGRPSAVRRAPTRDGQPNMMRTPHSCDGTVSEEQSQASTRDPDIRRNAHYRKRPNDNKTAGYSRHRSVVQSNGRAQRGNMLYPRVTKHTRNRPRLPTLAPRNG